MNTLDRLAFGLPVGAACAGLVAAAAVLLAGCASAPPPDAQSMLRRAEAASGSAAVHTLAFSAHGSGATFGQAYAPGGAWPKLDISMLTRTLDYDHDALREDFARSRAEATGGGALPLLGQGETKTTGFARGDFAWNQSGSTVTPSPTSLGARQHDLWTSPHGAIKAAQRHGATAQWRREAGQNLAAVSFAVPGQFEATLLIDESGVLRGIESRLPNPVLGDTAVSTRFDDWRDAGGGVRFPMRIRQSQGGAEVLDLEVTAVQPNAAVDIALPEIVRSAAPRAVPERIADGVWFIGGGSHNSVVIEMSDHLVLVESPLDDDRAAAVLAAAKQLSLGKPVRTVINSHHHFDHAGGLRAAVAEGATLVTSALAKPWFEQVFANPNRIRPDALARSGRRADIIGVEGKLALRDGARTIEIHALQGSVHAQGFLVVYLPMERLLIEADAFTPGPPNSPRPAQPSALHLNLVANIERLGLGVDRILPLHGRVVPYGELLAAVGRR